MLDFLSMRDDDELEELELLIELDGEDEGSRLLLLLLLDFFLDFFSFLDVRPRSLRPSSPPGLSPPPGPLPSPP